MGYSSIAEVHAALSNGATTVKDLVEICLESIREINPNINAFNALNERARDEAMKADEIYPSRRGPLHGVTIAIKDNIETAGIPTSFGSKACQNYVPEVDATLVRRLREAGAIIIGKTAIPDWCASFFSTSSLSGTTKNPHDTSRDPGGSSAGSGAAVAANMVLTAIGGDTWGSVRLPASYCGLVGIRCTPGRISSNGASPLLARQDTAGPITHCVEDAARILDVITGFDEKDSATSLNAIAHPIRTFLDATKQPTLKGKTLGVVREVFGTHHGIVSTLNKALDKFEHAGATLVEITIPQLEYYKSNTFFHYVSKSDINNFLAARPQLSHLKVEELHAKGIYHKVQDHIDLLVKGPDDPMTSPLYAKHLLIQKEFQNAVAALFAKHNLDALVYPTAQILAPKTQDVLDMKVSTVPFPTNTVIAAQLLFPAMSIPIGKTKENEDDANAVELPVGLEVVGLPLREEDLVAVGAGIESVFTLA